MGAHAGRTSLRLVPIGPRTLAVLHPSLAARYVRVVAAVAPAIEAGLAPTVAAHRVRVASVDPPVLRLRPFAAERARFRRRLTALADDHPCLLFADVRACYPSIAPSAVAAGLAALACHHAGALEVVRFLRRLGSLGVRGLPIGPEPSAVLANAVLSAVDRALTSRGLPYLRWVDDPVVGLADPGDATGVLTAVSEALAERGLALNPDKTHVVAAQGGQVGPLPISTGKVATRRLG